MRNGSHAGRLPLGEVLGGWVDRVVTAVVVLGLGVVLGLQYMAPDKRVLSVLAGLVVVGIAWRLEIIAGIGLVMFALPYPKGTTFGTTNLALILLLLVIYLLRVGQRELPRPQSTPIDMPVVGLLIAYVVSFYNVLPENLHLALSNFELFVGTLFLFYVVVNSIRTGADLRRLHEFQAGVLVTISLLALWELTHPGKALVPGWIDFTHTLGEAFDTQNVRIGGTFYDFELLADFCGLNVLFLSFLVARARDSYRRVYFGALLVLTVFIMFSTVTRGPIFSLGVAFAYGLWMMRRRLRVVPMVVGGAALAAVFLGANFVVANFTRSGDLLARLSQTEFKGLVPDTRAAAWQDAWDHFLLHPLIGSGPFYSFARGLYFWYWPHNLYLYVANIVGLFGLVFFLWLLWKLFVATRPTVDSPLAEDYVEAYMLLARVQLVFFLVDQVKIEYLRNATYQFQVWLMFAFWIAASRLRKDAADARAVQGA